MEDSFDEILSLVSQAKRDLYTQIGDDKRAQKAHIEAARRNLDAAIGAAREGKFRDALRLFDQLQQMLQGRHLLESEWAEIYVAQAICYGRLRQKKEMQQVWKQAYQLEPDNEELKRIAQKLGLLKSGE